MAQFARTLPEIRRQLVRFPRVAPSRGPVWRLLLVVGIFSAFLAAMTLAPARSSASGRLEPKADAVIQLAALPPA